MSSVSSSSSSSSEESGNSPSLRQYRLKYTIPPRLEMEVDLSMLRTIPHKSNPDKTIVVVPKFLSASRINQLLEVFRASDCVYEINDRKEDLYHAHTAYRVEIALRLLQQKTYRRMMETTVRVCDAVWGDIRDKKIRRNRIIPEIEYIVYNTPVENSKGTFIEPHVDNHSVVTGIVMLARPDVDFKGGVNCFKGSIDGQPGSLDFREVKLEQGDLVLFRGEIVTHWITPVERGRREILQWELSRI